MKCCHRLALIAMCGWLVWVAPAMSAAPSQVEPPAQVEFYDTAAVRIQNDQGEAAWRLPVHVHVFEPERRRLGVALMRKVIGLDDDTMTGEEQGIFRERAALFMVDNLREKQVEARVAGASLEVGPTGGNGQALGHLTLPDSQIAAHVRKGSNGPAWLTVAANTNFTAGRAFAGRVFLLEPRGITVISDIDDTIKISNVRNREEMMNNTFTRPFKPAPGMAALYRQWQGRHQCAFYYVSGSPRQLHQPLSEFLRTNGFPAGVFHLREFNFGNSTIFNLFKSPINYKIGGITGIFAEFPERRYVLVGDSGERDPEIYAGLAKAHPERVLKIFIRDVTEEGPEAERYQKLFEGMPAGLWRVFKDPAELRDLPLE